MLSIRSIRSYNHVHTETTIAIIQLKCQSIVIQCDLLPTALLRLLPQKDKGAIPIIKVPIEKIRSVSSKEEEESLPSEAEEYDLDTSYYISEDENTIE